MAVAKGYNSGQGSIFHLWTQSRSENPLCAALFWRAVIHSSIYPYIHAYAVQVHPMCLFLSTCLQVAFLLPFTSSNCYFSMFHSSAATMWHLMTSSVPLVCVSMAEDTSQWTSPDHWTVKSMGTPVGTVLEGHEQEHRDEPSTRSAGYTWYFDSLRWSASPLCNWDTDGGWQDSLRLNFP